MNKTLILLFCIIMAVLFSWTTDAGANETWDGCINCHGDFRSGPYISLTDGQSWVGSLHDIHRNDLLNGDCNVCHGSSKTPVYLATANGGDGLENLSCTGCHGRAEDGIGIGSVGYGAGLRQHHWNAGETNCFNCHQDADPASYTPVGENVLPPYYANPGLNHPGIPYDPCNPSPDYTEDLAGDIVLRLGLDNDGDGIYDNVDSDCSVAPQCTDLDNDGYSVEGGACGIFDCNDADPSINPGVAEVCDGIDNDCNGTIDDGFDPDGDGYTTCAGDCNGGDPSINPGAVEVCGNGIDENCDGTDAVCAPADNDNDDVDDDDDKDEDEDKDKDKDKDKDDDDDDDDK